MANSSIVTGGSVRNRTLTITPTAGQIGVTFITVNATDGIGLQGLPVTFELIVDNPLTMTTVPLPATVVHGKTFSSSPFTIGGGSGTLTTSVTAVTVSPAYNLWAAFHFAQIGNSYFQNSFGLNEKWIQSQTTGIWYIIQPSGALSTWNGSTPNPVFTPVTTDPRGNAVQLDHSYWQDPTKLTAPTAPFSIPASVVGNALQITPPLSYVGDVNVSISVTDGFGSIAQNFVLHVTDIAPSFNPIPNQTLNPSQSSVAINLPLNYNLNDPDDGVGGVTLDTSKAYALNAASLAYQLSQSQSLYFTGNYFQNSAGFNEKWVRSLSSGAWYIIQPNGVVSRWNGGSSYIQVAVLDSSYWNNPTTLVEATEPPALSPPLGIDDVNHIVTVPADLAQEVVKISATDGAQTTSQFFTLTVITSAPTFNLPNQQFAHSTPSHPQLTMNLTAPPFNLVDNNGKPLTTTLTVSDYVAGEAYFLGTSLNLQFKSSYFQDSAGRGERWLFGQATNSWYIIEPNGNFSKWTGGNNYSFIATLNFSYWNNPNLLINNNLTAPTPLIGPLSNGTASNGPLSAGVSGTTLTFDTNTTVAANYFVTVQEADSLSSTTQNFELSVTDAAPTFNLITPAPTTINHTATYSATINGIADADDGQAAVGFSASVYPYVPGLAYELQQTLQFYTTGNYFSSGTNPKWIRSAVNNSWYTISSTGLINKWNGGSSFTAVGTLDATYYADPTKLFNAPVPTDLTTTSPQGVAVSFTGTNSSGLTMNVTPSNATGDLLVRVKGSDSLVTTSQYFKLTVVTPTPSFNLLTPAPTSITHTQSYVATINNISDAPDPVTNVAFTASVYSYIPGLAYELNLQKSFFTTGNFFQNSAGLNEKWIMSATDNSWYIIEPTGSLLKWNGGSSFNQIAILSPAYWTDPSLLYNAQVPTDLTQAPGTFTATFSGTSANNSDPQGRTLTINPNDQNAGDFLVQVKGTNGGVTTSQFFKVTFQNFAPTFDQPADVSIPHQQAGNQGYTLDFATLNLADIDDGISNVTVGVQVYTFNSPAVAYQLNSTLNLFLTGNFFQNSSGLNEKWVRSHVNNNWYIIEPTGKFSLWTGGNNFSFVAQLDSGYWNNPSLLTTATAPPQATTPSPVASTTVVNSGSTHTVNVTTDPNFVGTLLVAATATDPTGTTTTKFFKLTTTVLQPTLDAIPSPQTLASNGTLGLELVGNDPDSGNTKPLNYTVSFTDLGIPAAAYNLKQSQNLGVDPKNGSVYFNYYGFNEIWLRNLTTGQWFGITPDGTVHQLDTKHLLGPVVATLDPSYYANNGAKLLNVQPPAPITISYTLSAANDVNNPDAMNIVFSGNGYVGTVQATVTVTNSVGATASRSFELDVS